MSLRASAGWRVYTPAMTQPLRIGVLADDLIWSSRLVAILRSAGAEPVAGRAPDALVAAGLDGVVVDLTARAYAGIEAVSRLVGSGTSVVCLAQHDDEPTRRAALAAGARGVYPYRTLHEKGAAALGRWLAELAASGVSPAPTP